MVCSIKILHVVAFLDLLSVGIIVPLLMIHVRKKGGNHIYMGLLRSLYSGLQLGSGPYIGSLSDVKGRKTILIITLLMSSAAYTIMAFASSIYVILLLRGFLGLFKHTQVLAKAMVPDYERNEQRQGEIYGKMIAVAGIGLTLGPVIGGYVAEDYSQYTFSMVAILVGICFLLNAGLVCLCRCPRKNIKWKSSSADRGNLVKIFYISLKQSFLELYCIEWSHYGDIFTYKLLLGFAMGVYYSIYGSLICQKFQLTPKYVGYIISFQNIIGSLSSYFLGYFNACYAYDNDFTERNFHIFMILTIALLGLIFSFNVYIYVIWLIPLSAGNAIGRVITLEMMLHRYHRGNKSRRNILNSLSDTSTCGDCRKKLMGSYENRGEHRGKLIGASNSVRSFSGVVSSLVAGMIGQWAGIGSAIYASLFATTIGVVLSYHHWRS